MPFYTRTRRRPPLWKPTAIGAGATLIWTVLRGMIAPGPSGSFLTGLLFTLLFPLLGGGLAALGYWLLGTPWIRPYLAARWGVGFVCTAAALLLVSAATTHPDFAAVSRSSGSSGFVVSTLVLAVVLGGVIGFELFSKGATERVYLTPAEYGALSAPEREGLRLDGDSPAA